jgi:hypothetical protein
MRAKRRAVALSAALVCLLSSRAFANGIPPTGALAYEGVLQEGGAPVTGARDISLALWNDPVLSASANLLCTTNATGVSVTLGRFVVVLDDACTSAVAANSDVWLQVSTSGVAFDRQKLEAVPYAVEANHVPIADEADALAAGYATTPAGAVVLSTPVPGADGGPPIERARAGAAGMFALDSLGQNAGQFNCPFSANCPVDAGAATPFAGGGLAFGGGASGEGIASQRAGTTGNPQGLDFYTSYLHRLSITNSGDVLGMGNLTAGTIAATGAIDAGIAPGLYFNYSNNPSSSIPLDVACNGNDVAVGGGGSTCGSASAYATLRESRPSSVDGGNNNAWRVSCNHFVASIPNPTFPDIPCCEGWVFCLGHIQ